MDDCRFDNLTRAIASGTDRRTALKGLAGGIAALAAMARVELGLGQSDITIEAQCKGNKSKCKKDQNCCSKKCRKGKCQCAGKSAGCKRDQGCCSGVCRDGRCDCGLKGDFCNNDSDCCSAKCSDGKCLCIRGGDRCNEGRECCSGACNSGFCSKG